MNKPNRFRFRAWDKKLKAMGSVTAMEDVAGIMTPTLMYNHRIYNMTGSLQFDARNCILMQSTGLCDANYREIFEGDIIALFDFDNQYDGAGYKVYFARGSFIISIEGKEHILATYDDSKSVEVVGNIYENPELIK